MNHPRYFHFIDLRGKNDVFDGGIALSGVSITSDENHSIQG